MHCNTEADIGFLPLNVDAFDWPYCGWVVLLSNLPKPPVVHGSKSPLAVNGVNFQAQEDPEPTLPQVTEWNSIYI